MLQCQYYQYFIAIQALEPYLHDEDEGNKATAVMAITLYMSEEENTKLDDTGLYLFII